MMQLSGLTEKVMFQVMSEEDVNDKEVLVIGDVHGCLDELTELIETNNVIKEKTIFIFCGDIINKGPFNLESLKYVQSLPNVYAVRGNHEEHILNFCQAAYTDHSFALPSKYQWIRELTVQDVAYLTNLPYTISVPSLNAVIVHAGLHPWKPLDYQRFEDMVTIRNIIDVDGEHPKMSNGLGEGVPWASCWSGPQHVYFGHDARRGLQEFPFCTGLDTGCVYGGTLTAKYLTGAKRLLTVKAKRTYQSPDPVPRV